MAAFHFKKELNNNRSVMDELPRGSVWVGVVLRTRRSKWRLEEKIKNKIRQKKRAEAKICRGSVLNSFCFLVRFNVVYPAAKRPRTMRMG